MFSVPISDKDSHASPERAASPLLISPQSPTIDISVSRVEPIPTEDHFPQGPTATQENPNGSSPRAATLVFSESGGSAAAAGEKESNRAKRRAGGGGGNGGSGGRETASTAHAATCTKT